MTDQQAPENQWLVVGPPGVGKTTFIQRQAERAAQKYGSSKVMLSSFTRAATAELVGREIPIDRQMIGTLHWFAWNSLGRPKITESLVKEWNEQQRTGAKPRSDYILSEGVAGNEPESGGATDGDRIYNTIENYRARMVNQIVWPPAMQAFYEKWCAFKKETESLDFTDLIETCVRDVAIAPGDPDVGFFDEAQDYSRLEFSLVSHWGKSMEFFFIAGDPDQAIFTFKGADPNIFLDPPTPEERSRVLKQSYRVPRGIHALAGQWIRRLSRRYPSVYLPRDYDGDVQGPQQITFKDAERTIAHAEHFIEDGKTIMFLGACGFHVEPIVRELRKQGIPFHNPYRRNRGDWNPLRSSKGTTTSDRIRAFLAGKNTANKIMWTADELKKWIPLLRSDGVLIRGAKTAINKIDPDDLFDEQTLSRYLTPEALRAVAAGDTHWLRQNLATQYQRSASYVLRIVERRGMKAINDTPQICVGTIHSVKGGESDVVYVDPTMSPAMTREWYNSRRESQDAIIRQYYVAVTRARETVVICRGSGPAVPIPSHAPETSEEEF